jgi:hypothetical protein
MRAGGAGAHDGGTANVATPGGIMPTLLGSVRRLVFTPSLAQVTFGKRGFPVEHTPATERLERIPQTVICGFEWAIDARDLWEVERRLSIVEPELRGFAYEGATMAFTVLDAFGGHRTRDLLLGSGQPHIFLTYIGIGFAMSRLPRRLWKKVVPDLTGTPYYPTMSWLAVDGYAFDRAYFHTRRWVDRQYVPRPYPWAGSPDYFPRAIDQGIGRALWFIHGGRVPQVAAAVRRFAEHRQADLWSGVGLAATFAGGCDPDDLTWLRKSADEHRAELGLGVVLAVRARDYAGFVPDYTAAAARVLGDVSVEDAVAIADSTSAAGEVPGPVPAYEMWRRRIRAHF